MGMQLFGTQVYSMLHTEYLVLVPGTGTSIHISQNDM